MFSNISGVRRPRDLLLAFELLCVFLLFFYKDGNLDKYIVSLFLGLILIIYISNFILGRVSTGDNYLFLIVSMFLSIGVVMSYRINQELGVSQIIWALSGILLFYFTYFAMKAIPKLENLGYLYYLLILVLFVITFIFASTHKGAKNWIKINNFSFQPTEISKVLLILFLASYYSKFQETVKKYVSNPSFLLVFAIYLFVGLLFIQRDLGTAVIFLAIFTGIQFIYEEDRRAIALNLLLMLAGAIAGYFLFGHVRNRVAIWLNPWKDSYGAGLQIVQSLISIAEGGFFGVGIGNGYPKQIPEAYTDAIFPVICEEMGILVGIGIVMLFILLLYRSIKIALEQKYIFYRILAIGSIILFIVQMFLNIGGITKIIPLTGITLPFISYGGSSLLSSFITLGILQVTSEDMSYKYERSE